MPEMVDFRIYRRSTPKESSEIRERAERAFSKLLRNSLNDSEVFHMSQRQKEERPRLVAAHIPGYDYGSPNVAKSPISTQEFELMKQSAGFTAEDEHWLRVAGEILSDQTHELVGKWREVIASRPHLAAYFPPPGAQQNAFAAEASGLRFQQWVMDTCFRPHDQDWLNYQQEMALRHTSIKKNKTDNVQSAPTIHLRHLISAAAVLNDPNILKTFLSKRGHSGDEVDKMHQAWSKSLWLQIALWAEPYTNPQLAPNEW
jgi:Protoglobin